MKFLLDTNICIYMIKKEPLSVLERLKHLTPDDIGISSVTVAELYYGVEKSQHAKKNKTALEKFLTPFEVLSFDDSAALCYGHIRAKLESIGQPIGPLDFMIAAHAISLKLTLISNNLKELIRVPGLKVENWT
jgi:tRNA(fMet)-specific endonuclease VapC